jgi:3-hydroxypropionyl-CoA synthetase (ADP-forming)
MEDLTTASSGRITAILDAAARDGRCSLYEHEVYGILDAIGLTVPRFRFVPSAEEAGDDILSALGRTLIIKIVSPEIPHKQKLGGVRKVVVTDTLHLQYALARMRDEVLSHFPPAALPRISGFLVVEFVPHTEALGYEVLIGLREDQAFGPVLTVSKGGDDAEFFAAHYDPANLFLPPLSYDEALAFTRSMHIRHKFEQAGHPEHLESMAKALAAFSTLAMNFSPLAHGAGGNRPPTILRSLEVNPFAIAADGRFIALDGLAEFGPAPEGWTERPRTGNIDAFFQPRGVAVIGVSADLSRYNMARDIAELLAELRPGDLSIVNPHTGTVKLGGRDFELYPSLADVPGPVELAVYAAPALNAPAFLRGLAGSSVRAVVLIPGVPSSVPYRQYAADLRAAVPPGIRVMGPNCMGVYHAAGPDRPGINTLFINEQRLEVRSSPTANAVLLTQSGALSVTVIDKLRTCRPLRAVVSFGNKFDVKVGELLAHFEADPAVAVIGVYLEGLDEGEGRAFFDRAWLSRKPIIAYKGGRTEAGARSAASHTASMSGNYEVFRAACEQSGVVLASTIEEFTDLLRVFSLLSGRKRLGNRVAGVVNAGFESTVSADELRGLQQARLSPATVTRLNAINRHGLVDTGSPFLDITPMADDAMYADFARAVIEDDAVDCAFVSVVPHAVSLKTVPETCRDPDGLAARLVEIARTHDKPLVVSVNAGRHYADFVAAIEEGGLPVYPDIRSAITSLDRFVSYCMGGHGFRKPRSC